MKLLYRALLLLYPSGFRREYGAEMQSIFAERCASATAAGRIALLLEAVRDVFANAAVLHRDLLQQDLRYALRTLRRAPGFAFTAIVVTALGVGANTAAFSVADFVLLRALPFPDAESLVRVCEGPRTGPVGWGCMNQVSPANYRDFRDQTTSFEGLAAFRRDAVNLVDGVNPQRLPVAVVTPDVFEILGVAPALGATFDAQKSTVDTRTAVISHRLWQEQFGGDAGVLGRTVSLDGSPHVVVGIMPATFHFPTRDVQLWTPLVFTEDDFSNRNNNYLEAVGRLRAGVTFERARADLVLVAERLANAFPDTNGETGVSFFRMREEYSPRYRMMLRALCGASLCILLLTCANLANLLLVRAGARERELAVRSALGAGRERLVRQMVTESVTLALVGGAVGVLVAWLVFPLLALMVPATLPIADRPDLNLRVLVFAAGFTAVTGLGFGLIPALRAGGRSAAVALRAGRSGGVKRGLRSVLVAVEVGASVVLLVSAGLLLRAMQRVQNTDPGFHEAGVLAVTTVLPKPKYLEGEKREQFYNAVLSQVRELPGVESAAYTTSLPMVMTGGIARVTTPGQEIRPDGDYNVSRRYISPQFFATLGIPMLRGRDFETGDAADRRRVGIISERFAERYWPGEDPVGRAFIFRDSIHTVVGVVGDIMVRGLERTSEPQLYLPTSAVPDGLLSFYDPKTLVIRTTGRELDVLPPVRDIVRGVDADQPVSDVMTLSDLIALQTAPRRAQVEVLGSLAVLALLLAGLGINGLLAYTVAQRQREIGVRLALGARPAWIARGILRDAFVIVMVGVIPGLVIAIAAARSMAALLSGVPTADPTTIVITLAVCVGMALTGALVPAWRAVRVSPLTVMRAE